MGDTSLSTESQPYQFSLHQGGIRVFLLIASIGTIAIQANWQSIEKLQFTLMLLVLTYTIASYGWISSRLPETRNSHFDFFTTLDAVIIAIVLSFSDFKLMPTILFVTMIQFSSLLNGGMRKWSTDSIALAGGIALSFVIHEPRWAFSDDLTIGNFGFFALFAYFCSYALYMHSHMLRINNLNKKLANEQVLYKLRTYKLARYLTPTVWKAVNEGREKSLRTERKRVTVFFSDIKGFSTLSEELEAENLTELLNSYLTEMAKIASKHKGTIDKFMGDAVMVIFGDADSAGVKADCLRCLSMAIEMRRKMKELQNTWYNQGIKQPLQIRMGINTGFCTVGSFGTSHYMDYTVLGTNVNLASRLESAAEPGEILVSHETWSLIKDVVMCRDKGEIKVKGFSHPVKTYQVVDFRKDLGRQQTYFEENAEGFSMHMDLEKIRNYDKDRVIEKLQLAAVRLRDKNIS
jgi:adenylate cyclase